MTGQAAVGRVLAERIGLDPATVGGGLLARALHARMAATGVPLLADYVTLLRGSRDEQDALIEEVVIPESWFFRDAAPFRLFRDHIRSGWLARPSRGPLRVLCIPCAGGEEPYSIAIALRELGMPTERWSIDAVDVSQRALAKAGRGIYGEHSFRGMDPDHRARYFLSHPKGHELDPSIRVLVRFHRGNLIDHAHLRAEPPYDVILCRNLLIYLDPDSRRKAFDTLARLLVPGGLLFLGHAERPEPGEARFEPVGDPGTFAYWHVEPRTSPELAEPKPRRVETVHPPARPRLPHAPPAPPRRRTLPAPAPKRQPVPPDEPKAAPALLAEAAALADRGKTGEAASICDRLLRESGPSAPAFFLLGMIRQVEGDAKRAEECWQKTVYLDPQHDEALLALALIADRRGDPGGAAGYRRRADRARNRKGRDDA